jgi:hypothetical protein
MNQADPWPDEASTRDLLDRLEAAMRARGADEPAAGFVAQGADGRVFFIAQDRAAAKEVAHGALYRAMRAVRQAPTTAQSRKTHCEQTWRWLETHDPDSDLWRLRCLLYFEHCV